MEWLLIGGFCIYLVYLCTTVPTKDIVKPTVFDLKSVICPIVPAYSEKPPDMSKGKNYKVNMLPLTPDGMADHNWLINDNEIDKNIMKLRRETEIKRKEDRDLSFRVKLSKIHRTNLEQRFPNAFITK